MNEPKIRLADFIDALDALCPVCEKAVRTALIKRLQERKRAEIEKDTPADLAALRRSIAKDLGLNEVLLLEHDNSARLVFARRRFAVEARKRGYSFPEIGRAISRHHTSIYHLVESETGHVEKFWREVPEIEARLTRCAKSVTPVCEPCRMGRIVRVAVATVNGMKMCREHANAADLREGPPVAIEKPKETAMPTGHLVENIDWNKVQQERNDGASVDFLRKKYNTGWITVKNNTTPPTGKHAQTKPAESETHRIGLRPGARRAAH